MLSRKKYFREFNRLVGIYESNERCSTGQYFHTTLNQCKPLPSALASAVQDAEEKRTGAQNVSTLASNHGNEHIHLHAQESHQKAAKMFREVALQAWKNGFPDLEQTATAHAKDHEDKSEEHRHLYWKYFH